MWNIERTPGVIVGPKRWQWKIILTAYGGAWGFAWTRRQAERRLYLAQADLLSDG